MEAVQNRKKVVSHTLHSQIKDACCFYNLRVLFLFQRVLFFILILFWMCVDYLMRVVFYSMTFLTCVDYLSRVVFYFVTFFNACWLLGCVSFSISFSMRAEILQFSTRVEIYFKTFLSACWLLDVCCFIFHYFFDVCWLLKRVLFLFHYNFECVLIIEMCVVSYYVGICNACWLLHQLFYSRV